MLIFRKGKINNFQCVDNSNKYFYVSFITLTSRLDLFFNKTIKKDYIINIVAFL